MEAGTIGIPAELTLVVAAVPLAPVIEVLVVMGEGNSSSSSTNNNRQSSRICSSSSSIERSVISNGSNNRSITSHVVVVVTAVVASAANVAVLEVAAVVGLVLRKVKEVVVSVPARVVAEVKQKH